MAKSFGLLARTLLLGCMLTVSACASDEPPNDAPDNDSNFPNSPSLADNKAPGHYDSNPLMAGTGVPAPQPEAFSKPPSPAPHQIIIRNQSLLGITAVEIFIPGSTVETGNVVARSPLAPGASTTVMLPSDAPCLLDVHVRLSNGVTQAQSSRNSCDNGNRTVTINMAAAPLPAIAALRDPHSVSQKTITGFTPPTLRGVPKEGLSAKGSFMVQLGAYPDRVTAANAWSLARGRYHGILEPEQPNYSHFYGPTGEWIRLRVGPFATKDLASGLCNHLQALNSQCFVTRS